jgi:phosphohistidine phosphatase SixA
MLLMRHASAGERLESAVRDRARKLDRAGRADARALPAALAAHAIDRIVSSPHARCLETVARLAHDRGLEVEGREELAPGASSGEILTLLAGLPEATLVCTHREVFERVFGGEITCEKGGTWLAERKGRRRVPVVVAYLPPPASGVPLSPTAMPAAKARRRAPAPVRRSRL